jgi:GNAT superfamily N-acetyltransferase
MDTAAADQILVRRSLAPGEADGIVDLHRRVYTREYARNEAFVEGVARGVDAALARGWPDRNGAVWLVDHEGRLSGSLGLTDEGDGVGRVRWFVLEPQLRGHGLGRRLIDELLDTARAAGMRKLELETFSELRAAARIYLDAGFRVVWSREFEDWGPPITYQRYELELG